MVVKGKWGVRYASLAALFVLGTAGCVSETAEEDRFAGTEDEELESTEEALIGGVENYTHPDVGRLLFANNTSCTGTLITQKVVITAAHCIGYKNYWDSTYMGKFQIQVPSAGGVKSYSFSIIRGLVRTFVGGNASDDIALLQLSTAVPTRLARAYTIATSYPARGTPAALYGYGCQARGTRNGSGIKQRLDFPYGPTKSLCPGDSGGPQMTGDKGIVGINSAYGNRTGDDRFGDVPKSNAWIVQYRDYLDRQ